TFTPPATSVIYTLSLHDALPILILRAMFATPWRLRTVFAGLRFYQRSPLPPIVRRFLPRRLRQMEAMIPKLPGKPYDPPEVAARSEEHTSELQSRENLVCRLLLE